MVPQAVLCQPIKWGTHVAVSVCAEASSRPLITTVCFKLRNCRAWIEVLRVHAPGAAKCCMAIKQNMAEHGRSRGMLIPGPAP